MFSMIATQQRTANECTYEGIEPIIHPSIHPFIHSLTFFALFSLSLSLSLFLLALVLVRFRTVRSFRQTIFVRFVLQLFNNFFLFS